MRRSLADEPLSNLDAQLRVQMRGELKRLHARLGATVIYVTHDQVEAMTLGSRVVVMKDGCIQQVGEPLEVYSRSLNRFVAGFIGSPAMNFIPVNLTPGEAGLCATAADFSCNVPADRLASLADYRGQAAILGVRPEDIRIAVGASEDSFEAVVEVVEPLGAEILLETRVAGQVMLARVDASVVVRPGEKIAFLLQSDRIHFFDAENGNDIR